MRMRRIPKVAVTAALATSCGVVAVVTALPAGSAAAASTDTTPIIVGGVGTTAVSQDIAQGFEAGIYRFNKAGGLDGRKIDFVGFKDDGFSPETNLTAVQQLVEADHVMVVAPFWSEVSTAGAGTFLASHQVPFIGWASSAAYVAAPTWGYGITGSDGNPTVQRSVSQKQLLQAMGHTKDPKKVKIAFIGNNYAATVIADNALAGDAKFAGINVVYNKGVIPISGTTSYAPYAQALVASGANVVYEVLGSADAIGLAGALKAAGYKGAVFNGVTYYPGQLANQPNEAAALNGVYVENEFPLNEDKTPAVKQAEKDLKAVGAPTTLPAGAAIGYWSAIMLEQMLKATLAKEGGDPAKVTGATIQQTVNAGFTYKDPIAGGIGTVQFPQDETIPSGCGTLVKTVGTNFKLVEPYVCTNDVNVKQQKAVNQLTGKPMH